MACVWSPTTVELFFKQGLSPPQITKEIIPTPKKRLTFEEELSPPPTTGLLSSMRLSWLENVLEQSFALAYNNPLLLEASQLDTTSKITSPLTKDKEREERGCHCVSLPHFVIKSMLPCVQTNDLSCIVPDTVALLLRGAYTNIKHVIVDCRYPYEYNGGHIKESINVWKKESLIEKFFTACYENLVIVFYCEFSSMRGPKMVHYFREMDRKRNLLNYPHLSYPFLYLIEGGYKRFYESHRELCEPTGYTKMRCPENKQELQQCKKELRADI